MPSLRDRSDDIPLLVEYFIGRFGKKAGKKFRTIDRKTARLFEAYQWPGNIRELQNVIQRAVILSEDDTFSVDEAWLKQSTAQFRDSPTALNRVLLRREKEMIESALAESGGTSPVQAAQQQSSKFRHGLSIQRSKASGSISFGLRGRKPAKLLPPASRSRGASQIPISQESLILQETAPF